MGALGPVEQLLQELGRIEGYLYTLVHPNLVIVALLKDSLGLLLKVWSDFILHTTDFETGADFVKNATILQFEPSVQLASDGALVLIAMWASYRIMWGHGLRSQYTARILLPRLLMGVVLINFSQPMFQAVVAINNALCDVVQSFVKLDDLTTLEASFASDPRGAWEIITTGVLAAGYDALAIAYFVRYAILIVLAITAPLAGLMFTLPETHHISKQWMSYFTTNLFMQPAQLFILAIGFGLERNGSTPVHHLFALASLLLVFKVPGALGGAEKAAHKMQSTVESALHHVEHALAKA